MRLNNYGMKASRWTPPPEMLRIAQERTHDIIGAWGNQLRWGSREPVPTIQHLAESCYMQGINDSIDAITREGVLERLNKPELRNLPA